MPPENTTQRIAASYRDPAGFVFTSGNDLLRQINKSYLPDYTHLMSSGLYQKLLAEGLLVPHEEVSLDLACTPDAALVIRPEKIPYISYPYEWSFSQLKDAALVTLRIQQLALEHGMILKDASAYNIQFLKGKAVLIDTLSFGLYKEGQQWEGYGQFCRHFLAPLLLMRHTDIRLSRLQRVFPDGIPLDMASNMLPFKSRLSPLVFMHIYVHAKGLKAYAGKAAGKEQKANKPISKFSQLAMVNSLESGLKSLELIPPATEWGDYYNITNYSDKAFDSKKQIVADLLKKANPKVVWDLGANDGTFSRLAAAMQVLTVSFDIDPVAVDSNYRQMKRDGEKNLVPLVLDLTDPSPASGWGLQERLSVTERTPADTAMALALIHHLAITYNLPFDNIARFLSKICRFLIIEFVPKSDSQVVRMLSTRDDIFVHYHLDMFRSEFSRYFSIVQEIPVPETERTLFLMEVK